MIVAFSRSRNPTLPISCDTEIMAPCTSSATISAARCSMAGLTGENTEVIATARMPLLRYRAPRPAIPSRRGAQSRGRRTRDRHGRDSGGKPSAEPRSSGQSIIGGRHLRGGKAEAEGGDFQQAFALNHRIREMRGADHQRLDLACRDLPSRSTASSAPTMPRLTSGVVCVLCQLRTCSLHQDGVRVGPADVDTDMHVPRVSPPSVPAPSRAGFRPQPVARRLAPHHPG